jgi:hypothetical protein
LEAYLNRAYLRQRFGNFDGAISDCDSAISINPILGVAYELRSLAKKAKHDIVGAEADARSAARLGSRKYIDGGQIKRDGRPLSK